VSDIPQAGPQGSSNRALKAVVIGLGVLIVIAFGLLVAGFVVKMGGRDDEVGTTARFALPPGAKIVEMQSQPNRLILHVRTAAGEEVDIIDTSDGHLVSQIRAAK